MQIIDSWTILKKWLQIHSFVNKNVPLCIILYVCAPLLRVIWQFMLSKQQSGSLAIWSCMKFNFDWFMFNFNREWLEKILKKLATFLNWNFPVKSAEFFFEYISCNIIKLYNTGGYKVYKAQNHTALNKKLRALFERSIWVPYAVT